LYLQMRSVERWMDELMDEEKYRGIRELMRRKP